MPDKTFAEKLNDIANKIANKVVDNLEKSCYDSNTSSTFIDEPGTFTMADLDKAIKLMGERPKSKLFIFSSHLPDDDCYKAQPGGIGFFRSPIYPQTDEVYFCGMTVAEALHAEGINVINFQPEEE